MFTVYECGHLSRIFLEHLKYLVNENYTTGYTDQAIFVDPCWNGREVGYVISWNTDHSSEHPGAITVMNDRHGIGMRLYHGNWHHGHHDKMRLEMCSTPEMAAQEVWRYIKETAAKVKPAAVQA